MIGDVAECTTLAEDVAEYTLYVPLQFWFNRNTGLALPLIALQYHEVRFNIEFNRLADLVVKQGTFTVTGDLSDTSILVDYVYLDQEERRRMAQVGHEYLIEQIQFGGEESVTGTQQKVKLDFNHPCKELVWAVRVGAFSGAKNYLAHFQTSEAQLLEDAAKNLAWGMVSVGNGPSGTWTAVNVAAAEEIAAGAVGLINVTQNLTTFTFVVTNNSAAAFDGTQFAGLYVNSDDALGTAAHELSEDIKEVTVNVTVGAAAIAAIELTDVTVTRHTLTVANVSVPVANLTDNRAQNADVTVNQPFNYGLDLAGNGNPVTKAKLQLNGHDRFDEQEGPYFNYVQPFQHHTRTPCDGVNVYSFGLHPEQHQPSGTANLSRIDTTLLHLVFGDNVARDLTVNVVTDSLLWIFAFSYNVFRIMSGMGGLAYAN